MPVIKIVALVYGIFLIVGAYFGWKAGSQVSLAMGLVSGLVVLFCAILMESNIVLGTQLIGGVSGLLAIVFLMRFLKTKMIMPSGMLLAVSLVVLIVAVSQLIKK